MDDDTIWDDFDDETLDQIEECEIRATQACAKAPSPVKNPPLSSGNRYDNFSQNRNVSYADPKTSISSNVARKPVNNLIHRQTNDDICKIKETLLQKQGEISVLRSQLEHKESALEAAKLDRCMVIESSEKKIKEKVANLMLESEKKSNEFRNTIDKLQTELLFKSRECDELVTKCRTLEKKSASPLQVMNSPSKKRKLSTGFEERFDFSHSQVSKAKSNAAVQTDKCETNTVWKTKKKYIKLHSGNYSNTKMPLDIRINNGDQNALQNNNDLHSITSMVTIPGPVRNLLHISKENNNCLSELTEEHLELLNSIGDTFPTFTITTPPDELRNLFQKQLSDKQSVYKIEIILGAISALCTITNFISSLCDLTDKCFLKQLLTIYNKRKTLEKTININLVKRLYNLVSLILNQLPSWYTKCTCSCSTILLCTLLESGEDLIRNNCDIKHMDSKDCIWHLEEALIYLLHSWQYVDVMWLERISELPQFFSFTSKFAFQIQRIDSTNMSQNICQVSSMIQELMESVD